MMAALPHHRARQNASGPPGRLLYALVLSMLLSAGAAVAQSSPIIPRAGEHATFTRVVLRLAPGMGWTMTQAPRQIVLTLDPAPAGFDLSEVFRRIPRTRLESVRTASGQLFLDLACDCVITAEQEPSGLLIIDMASPVAQTTLPDQPRRPQRRPDAAPGDTTGSAGEIVAQRRTAQQTAPVATMALWEQRLLEQTARTEPPPVESSAPPVPLVAREIQGVLARQLARAAGQGVVTLRPNPTSGTAPAQSQVLVSTQDDPNLTQEALGEHLRLANKAIADNLMAQVATSDAATCYADDLMDLAAWAKPDSFHAQLAQHRQDLVAEGAADNLRAFARFYLHFGFGSEAASVLIASDANLPLDDVLRTLAAVMDSRPLATDSPLPDMLHCDGRAALWALLATGSAARADHINARAIGRAFAELPDHLRRDLGPRVAARLLEHDQTDAAQLVRLSMERIGNADPDQVAITAARIALVEEADGTSTTGPALGDLPTTSESVMLQLEHALTHPEHLTRDLTQTGLSYANDLKGTPDGARLYALAVEALARQGGFDEAFATLNRLTAAGGIGLPPALRDVLFDLASETGSDAQFVATVFDQQPWLDPARLRASTREMLANRLADLGFLSHANALAPMTPVGTLQVPAGESAVDADAGPSEAPAPPAESGAADAALTSDTTADAPELPATTPQAIGNALLDSSSALRAELQALIAAQ
ncbi:hypothetical protein [Roseicitreum antarcticum]|uniref:Uncharacterized protein n=1 Tax=Roseicitreum antarcticum TaxID=564137 RepID=A0A1H2UQW5_9RHOB|nr:hypothetical protein [Roseicitreum antarcticum]SDW58523.1 hypothetical protein SAMN04488238_102468 [Roseicitreum antarcticum]